jgi:hypothetical protein
MEGFMKRTMLSVLIGLMVLGGTAFAQQKFIAIGTGGAAGTYYPLGGAMAEI